METSIEFLLARAAPKEERALTRVIRHLPLIGNYLRVWAARHEDASVTHWVSLPPVRT